MHKESPIRHILVLIDSTDTSERAVNLAIALAHALHARLTGLNIIEIETLHQLLSARVLTDVEMIDFETGLRESGNRQLEAARARAHEQGVDFESDISTGNSEVVIPQLVQDRGIDLIVLGAFDSEQVRYELLFRQRQQVIDHAPCPVLVAR